jgi:hypothetical protein
MYLQSTTLVAWIYLTAMEIAVEVVRAMAFGMAMEIKKTSMK